MFRIVSATALALSLAAGSAYAQSYTAPAGIPETTAPGGTVQRDVFTPNRAAVAPSAYDTVTTGTVVSRSGERKPVRR